MPAAGGGKPLWGWALYDFANSAFATTVLAGFFPVFFRQYWSAGADPVASTALLGLGNSLAGLVVALAAPLLGAVADRGGAKKAFLYAFTWLGAAATAALYLAGPGQWGLATALFVLANLGFAGGLGFYDALLPSVAPPGREDAASALGYGLGYLGGGLLFALNLLMVCRPGWFGLADAGEAVRWSFVSVALWWAGFSLFGLAWLPGRPAGSPGWRRALGEGLGQLAGTLRSLRRHRRAGLFLLAYWLYIDGVDTVIRMAVDYGLALGFAADHLLLALLLVQLVGFPAALAYGRLGQRFGTKRALLLAIAAYLLATLAASRLATVTGFYALAVFIALFQGGIQALSRSFFARLVPSGQSGEFFGFYNLLGKFAVLLGPLLVGGAGLLARVWLPAEAAARVGILAVGILFLAGGYCLWRVEEAAPAAGEV